MLAGAPRFEEIAPTLLDKLRGRLFVAHNARFDYSFLKREFRRIGIDFRASNLCTVKLSRKLFPEHHRHSLDALIKRHGIVVGDRHRALADARVLWDLWQCWHASLPVAAIRSAVETIVGRPEPPPQLDPGLVDDLPEAPGAYALYGERGDLLLVKRCANIRQQVLAHFATARRDTALARNTFRIDWREAAGELGARLYELALSAPQRKPAEDLCAWQLVPYDKGGFRPQLVFARDTDFATTVDLFGLYANRREAMHALRRLAEAHRLCHSHTGLSDGKPGEPCVAYKQKTCRGVCVGKESVALHGARLLAAITKFRLGEWPFPGPVALIERDEFGMHEDFHLFDRWRYLGTAHDETSLRERLECSEEKEFDPDVYRIANKFLKIGKIRVQPLSEK